LKGPQARAPTPCPQSLGALYLGTRGLQLQMEVRLEACGDQIIPQDIYVSLRIGNVQKQSKYAPSRIFHFPELKEGKAGVEFGRVEVFKRLGTCTVPLDNLGLIPQEVKVPVPESPLDTLHFRLDTPADVTGTQGVQDRARERALKKKQRLEEAQRYVADHNLEELLATSLHNVMKEKPDNPASFLSGHLLGGKDLRPRPLLTPLAQAPAPSPPLSTSGPSPFQLPPSSPPPLSKHGSNAALNRSEAGSGHEENGRNTREGGEKKTQVDAAAAAVAAEEEARNDEKEEAAPAAEFEEPSRTEDRELKQPQHHRSETERIMNGDWRTMSSEAWTSLYSRFPARRADMQHGGGLPEAWGTVQGRFVLPHEVPAASEDAEVRKDDDDSPPLEAADPVAAVAENNDILAARISTATAPAPASPTSPALSQELPSQDVAEATTAATAATATATAATTSTAAQENNATTAPTPSLGDPSLLSVGRTMLPPHIDAAYIQKLKEQILLKEAKLKSLASQLLDLSQTDSASSA